MDYKLFSTKITLDYLKANYSKFSSTFELSKNFPMTEIMRNTMGNVNFTHLKMSSQMNGITSLNQRSRRIITGEEIADLWPAIKSATKLYVFYIIYNDSFMYPN